MRWTIGVLIIGLAACLQTKPTTPPTDPIRHDSSGVAIDGYSPVSYFTEGRAERGSAQFAVPHGGVTYWLANRDQANAFRADPERYVPAHGGWCTLMMGGSGRRTPGHPEAYDIVDGRLLLFWSGDTDQTRGMGLTNWRSKTDNDQRQKQAYVAKANRQWQQYLAGQRQSPIMLFKPGDVNGVSEAQRAVATEQFIE